MAAVLRLARSRYVRRMARLGAFAIVCFIIASIATLAWQPTWFQRQKPADPPLHLPHRGLKITDELRLSGDIVIMNHTDAEKLHRVVPRKIGTVDRPPYLPHFKNPCWLEETPAKPLCDNSRRIIETASQRNGTTMFCLPYFIMAGFPKAGCTDLHQSLSRFHPQIRMPAKKEPHFWDYAVMTPPQQEIPLSQYICDHQDSTRRILEKCDPFDKNAPCELITGDVNARYMWQQPYWDTLEGNIDMTEPIVLAQHLMYTFMPDVKILVALRDPVERLYSEYCHMKEHEKPSPEEFHNIVLDLISDYEECLQMKPLRACVYYRNTLDLLPHLAVGLYHVFFTDWLAVYPREQFHIIRLEDYSEDRLKELNKIVEFLGLDPIGEDRRNAIARKRISMSHTMRKHVPEPMWNSTRELLRGFYAPHNARLPEVIGRPDMTWSYT